MMSTVVYRLASVTVTSKHYSFRDVRGIVLNGLSTYTVASTLSDKNQLATGAVLL